MTGMESVMKAKCLWFRKYTNTFVLAQQYLLTITEALGETDLKTDHHSIMNDHVGFEILTAITLKTTIYGKRRRVVW
jgi:hypothetical protein